LLLLRLRRLGDRREEIEADLAEQYRRRRIERGRVEAAWRYVADALSLWRVVRTTHPRRRRSGRVAVHDALRDIGLALRLIRQRPGLIGLTLAGLGLAMGVTTAVFSLVNAAGLRPAGLSDPDSVVSVVLTGPDTRTRGWRYEEFSALRAASRTTTLEALLYEGVRLGQAGVSGRAESVQVHIVSGGYLATMGARPVLGRLLGVADDAAQTGLVAVLSEGFWTRRLQRDPAIIGASIVLGDTRVVVVGVVGRAFRGPTWQTPAVWLPWGTGRVLYSHLPDAANASIVGRLRPGVAVSAAEAELSAVARAVAAERPAVGTSRAVGVRLGPAPTRRGESSAISTTVLIALALMVILASANLANLLLAVAGERGHELAVRLALGAGRLRLVRQLLAEGVVYGGLGAAAGLTGSFWLGPAFAEVLDLPSGIDIAIDRRVYAFVGAAAVSIGGLAALAPIRFSLRADVSSPMKGITTAGRAYGRRTRSWLVAIQAATSLLLLAATSVLGRSVVNAATVDMGFNPDRLVAVSPRLSSDECDDACVARYLDAAAERLRAVPDIEAVALTANPPLLGSWFPVLITRDGRQHTFARNKASANYPETLGLRIVRGRALTDEEVATEAPVAVVTERLASLLWPGGEPLGAVLNELGQGFQGVRVVGVATDTAGRLVPQIRYEGLFTPLPPDRRGTTLMVRLRGGADDVLPRLHAAVSGIDPEGRVVVIPLRDAVSEEVRPVRAIVAVSSLVALAALGLAVVGLHGMTAFAISQRTHEVGIRMTLGATGRDIARLFAGTCLRPAAIGLAIGLGLAIVAGKLYGSLILGVSPTDPAALATAAGVLALSALAAVASPARRASRVDPATVLRQL
jgi:predicted permease